MSEDKKKIIGLIGTGPFAEKIEKALRDKPHPLSPEAQAIADLTGVEPYTIEPIMMAEIDGASIDGGQYRLLYATQWSNGYVLLHPTKDVAGGIMLDGETVKQFITLLQTYADKHDKIQKALKD